jgi:hypothetical protein
VCFWIVWQEDAAKAQVEDVAKAHAVVVELERRLEIVDAEKSSALEQAETAVERSAAAETKARMQIEELQKKVEAADAEIAAGAAKGAEASQTATEEEESSRSKPRTSTEDFVTSRQNLVSMLGQDQAADDKAVAESSTDEERSAAPGALEADVESSSDAGSFYSADEAAAKLSKERTEAELEEQRALTEVLSSQLADTVAQQTEMAAVAAGLERAVQEEKDRALVAIAELERATQEEKDKVVAATNELQAVSSRADILEDQLSVMRAEAAMQEGQHARALGSANKAADEAAAQLHAAEKSVREAQKNAEAMAVTLAGKAEVEVRCAELTERVKKLEAEVAAAQEALEAQPPRQQHRTEPSAEPSTDSAPQDEQLQQRIQEKEELILEKEQQIIEQDGKHQAILQQVAVLLQDQEEQKRQLAAASKSLLDERAAGAEMTVALDTAYRRVSELEAELKEAKATSAADRAVASAPKSSSDGGGDAERERVTELETALREANEVAKEAREQLLRSEGAESAAVATLRQRDEQLAQMQLERATAAAEAAMAETPTRPTASASAQQRHSPPQTPATLAQADALAVRVGELEVQLQASDAMYEELQAETITKEEELSNMGKKLRELRAQVRSQPSSPPRGPTATEQAREREEREREAAHKAEVVAALQLASEELKEAQAELEVLRRAKESAEGKAASAEKKLAAATRQRRQRRSGEEGSDAAALEEAESEIQRLKGCLEELLSQLGVLEAASRKARAAVRHATATPPPL